MQSILKGEKWGARGGLGWAVGNWAVACARPRRGITLVLQMVVAKAVQQGKKKECARRLLTRGGEQPGRGEQKRSKQAG